MGKAKVVNLLNVDDPVSCLIRAPPHHAFYPCTPLTKAFQWGHSALTDFQFLPLIKITLLKDTFLCQTTPDVDPAVTLSNNDQV